jgi:hypothetical protein
MNFSDGLSSVGLLLTVVGMAITIREAVRARRAAVSARDAAEQARQACLRASAITDLAGVIGELGELKVLHRSAPIEILPRRYDSLRQQIVILRKAEFLKQDRYQNSLQSLATKMAGIEKLLDAGMTGQDFLGHMPRFNALITRSVDILQEVMAELTIQIGR